METRFDVYLSGEVVDGFTRDQVREGLGRLFSIDSGAAERLVNGERHRVKQQCDKATALQYREALLGIGAQVTVERHPPTAITTDEGQPPDQGVVPAPPPVHEEHRDPESTSGSSGLGIAPVGALMSEGKTGTPPAPVEVPDYDLAPAGAPIPSVKVDRTPLDPPTDHLQLTPIDDQ